MNAAERLIAEASALYKSPAIRANRRNAALEASAINAADLADGPESRSNALVAMRALLLAMGQCEERELSRLNVALGQLIAVVRAKPKPMQTVLEPRRYWIEGDR